MAQALSFLFDKTIVMKKAFQFYCISAMVILLFGCNSGTDPVKEAKKENTEKIDSQAKTQASNDSVAALPSVADADFLVNAASGQMLEMQLGQLAKENARKPEQEAGDKEAKPAHAGLLLSIRRAQGLVHTKAVGPYNFATRHSP